MEILSSSAKNIANLYMHSGYISGSSNVDMLQPDPTRGSIFISLGIGIISAILTGGVAVLLRKKLFPKMDKNLYIVLSVGLALIIAFFLAIASNLLIKELIWRSVPIPKKLKAL